MEFRQLDFLSISAIVGIESVTYSHEFGSRLEDKCLVSKSCRDAHGIL